MTIDLQHLEDEGAGRALYGPQMPLGAPNPARVGAWRVGHLSGAQIGTQQFTNDEGKK